METKGASFSDLQQEIARIQFQHRSAMARVEEQEKQGDRVEITPASQICNRRSLEFNFSIDLPWHQLKNRRSRKIGWRGRFFQNVTVPLTERFHSSMAFYADEDDVWRCADHPSKRRNIGVCPACLREKLTALCPERASLRPCNCCSTNSASSSSSSSSLSFISFPGDATYSNSACDGSLGSVWRVSNLIESEQSYRRSRSVAVPFFKSARFSSAREFDDLREISAALLRRKGRTRKRMEESAEDLGVFYSCAETARDRRRD